MSPYYLQDLLIYVSEFHNLVTRQSYFNDLCKNLCNIMALSCGTDYRLMYVLLPQLKHLNSYVNHGYFPSVLN